MVEVESEVEEMVARFSFVSSGEDKLLRLKQLEAKRKKLILDKESD